VVLETPVHVGQKLVPGLPNLRHRNYFPLVRDAIHAASCRFGIRIIHYSVLKNHLHLIVEAESERALARGMQGLFIRIAKRLNSRLKRKGPVFTGRYFAGVLTTDEYARFAINYVLKNEARHAQEQGRKRPPMWIDPCSSGHRFTGWLEVKVTLPDDDLPIGRPQSERLRVGWMRGWHRTDAGDLEFNERGISLTQVPGPMP
jgi:REP element-mobilizing transposase RayT